MSGRWRLDRAGRRMNALVDRWFGDDDPAFARRLRIGVVLVALWLSLEVDLRHAHLPKGATVSVLGLVLPAAVWSSPALLWATRLILWGGALLGLVGSGRDQARKIAGWTTALGMLLLGSLYWENLPWFRHKFVAPLWILALLAAAEHRPGRAPAWLREGAVLVLAAFYGGAGIAKLQGSGLAWADGVGLQLWMLRLGDRESVIRGWIVDDATLAAVIAGGALALELAAIGLVFWPGARRVFGCCLLGLHLGIDQILHIDFRPQMVLVALVLLPRGRAHSLDSGS